MWKFSCAIYSRQTTNDVFKKFLINDYNSSVLFINQDAFWDTVCNKKTLLDIF